ncbi:MAG: dihydrofolate reductase [Candidatus Aenigmarchaeota archaeon]|nr:dihydrofolate reductase [Candidatus Aenigmarchaeota archaeon]
MSISIIAAIGKNNVIGFENKLPWKMKADMKRFVEKTKGKTVVMGRKTFESIGKPLKYRTNIILTRNADFEAELRGRFASLDRCTVANSIEEVFEITEGQDEIIIIGGASLYKQFLPRAQRMYLTIIDYNFDGDTFFPEFDTDQWIEKEKEAYKKDSDNPYDYTFVTLERK